MLRVLRGCSGYSGVLRGDFQILDEAAPLGTQGVLRGCSEGAQGVLMEPRTDPKDGQPHGGDEREEEDDADDPVDLHGKGARGVLRGCSRVTQGGTQAVPKGAALTTATTTSS